MVSARLEAQPAAVRAGATLPASEVRAVLDKDCVTCHNTRVKTAGLLLDTADVDVAANAAMWEKVVRKLHGGLMPPLGRARPDAAAMAGLIASLEASLDRAAAAHPDPGRTAPFHRLNRTEYQNAIRDLFDVDGIDIAAMLPADDMSFGFDNIGGVLRLSSTPLERYLSAARKISRMIVNDPRVPFDSRDVPGPRGYLAGRPSGGSAARHAGRHADSALFPIDGEYR